MIVAVVNKSDNALPEYETPGSAGLDIRCTHAFAIDPTGRTLVPTGLFVEIPKGYEIQVRPRSGLALKNGITVLNTPGTVDSGYRGEIKVILYNTGDESFTIKNGDRIAQGVIAPVQIKRTTKFITVNQLDDSDRGTGGFGSTGLQ